MNAEDFFDSGGGSNRCNDIAEKLRQMIASGEAPKGKPLKGATALGRLFGCSGSPVETARRKLVKEGLLVKKDGHYFVTDNVLAHGKPDYKDGFESLLDE